MTAKQIAAVGAYTGEKYSYLNRMLRGSAREKPEYVELANDLSSAVLSGENMTEPKFAIAIGKVYEEIERLGDRIDKVQYAYDE